MTLQKQNPPPFLLAQPFLARHGRRPLLQRLLHGSICWLAALCTLTMVGPAGAGPALVIEMPSGAILYEDRATQPWFPASLTKLMTVYVALSAVRDHRISLDTPLVVSVRATAMPPSKMGFRPGTLVTLDNALRMLMVKSANDMAVVIAEGVSGSVEAFADDMNEAAHSLGLSQSHFVNPNGLPNPEHVSSARDLAILARALYLNFPEQAGLYNIGALQLGDEIIHNHNDLLGRYPGMDGMKTGFTCAAGYNLVASATQNGRKLIAVILGAPNVKSRATLAATLFDRGFSGIDQPSKSLADLVVDPAANRLAVAADQHNTVCGKRGRAAAEFNVEIARLMAPLLARHPHAEAPAAALLGTPAYASGLSIAPYIASIPRPAFAPVPVSLGAPEGYTGQIAQARPDHSPIGTPAPPSTVAAYAETPVSADESRLPLAPAPEALPLKGHSAQAKTHAASARHHGRGHIKLASAAHAAKPQKTTHAATAAKGHKEAGAKPKAGAHPKTATKQAPAKAAAHVEKGKSKKLEKHAER
ncbi:MAG: serine hydrolase [Alphaproteobacteria bacterium]|nr:serine hydrolase [Alphaproteobacteria bacterium]